MAGRHQAAQTHVPFRVTHRQTGVQLEFKISQQWLDEYNEVRPSARKLVCARFLRESRRSDNCFFWFDNIEWSELRLVHVPSVR